MNELHRKLEFTYEGADITRAMQLYIQWLILEKPVSPTDPHYTYNLIEARKALMEEQKRALNVYCRTPKPRPKPKK